MNLYKKLGFKEIRFIRNYYHLDKPPDNDAYLMVLEKGNKNNDKNKKENNNQNNYNNRNYYENYNNHRHHNDYYNNNYNNKNDYYNSYYNNNNYSDYKEGYWRRYNHWNK